MREVAHPASLSEALSLRATQVNSMREQPARLTEREHAVLARLGEAKTNAEIGRALFTSESAVKQSLTSILRKLGLGNRTGAALYFVKERMRVEQEEREREWQQLRERGARPDHPLHGGGDRGAPSGRGDHLGQ
jgi:DNA-binding CsgD family transcriptional regulator